MKIKQDKLKKVYLDTIPNLLKDSINEKKISETLLSNYNGKIAEIIDRYKNLPAIVVDIGVYTESLKEARQVYIEGYFYSCIAMCCVTAEKIAKDILIQNLFIQKDDNFENIPKEAIKYFEKINLETIREILIKSNLISGNLRNPYKKLVELRNRYMHIRDITATKSDAISALNFLNFIIEDTISLI
ncbi:MAG: hypothetical protein P9M11_07530 [Candidatus Tenebribacter burtonii]|nr:hypothetical protein [Candidatus Tenebribacter burtonii]